MLILVCCDICTENLNKVFPRLRDPACGRGGDFTQLKKSLFEGLGNWYGPRDFLGIVAKPVQIFIFFIGNLFRFAKRCQTITQNAEKFSKASVLMQRLSYPPETVLSNKITRNRRIVLSF